MKLPYDIIVPSKRRPNGSTFQLLESSNIPYTVVLEKEDVPSYSHLKNATIRVLPKSGKGIGYSRSVILQTSIRPFVMMDDDIETIYKRVRGYTTLQKISLLRFLQAGYKHLTKHGLGVVGYKHTSFAIPDHRTTKRTTVAHMVFINPDILRNHNVCYDATLKVFEDIDLLFQCVREGVLFERLNHYVYYTSNPSGTSSIGGIDYSGNIKRHFLRLMVRRWPAFITEDKEAYTSTGQPMYHIAWK